MKKNILSNLLILLFTLHFSSVAQAATLDKIVAIINDDVVTQSELKQNITIVKLQLTQQAMPVPANNILQEQVLEQLINKKLQLQIAKQVGIKVTAKEVDAAIKNIAQQNAMTLPQFYKRLQQEGMDKSTYVTEMREQITLQKLQQQEIYHRIQITPEEVAKYSNNLPPAKNIITGYHLQDILIPLADDPSAQQVAQTKQLAQTIFTKLQRGTAVQRALAQHSQVKMIDLGMRDLNNIPSAFVTTLSTNKNKTLTAPIQTGNGFHVLRVLEVRRTKDNSQRPSKKEIENLLGQRKLEQEMQTWLAKIRSQAYIVNKLHA